MFNIENSDHVMVIDKPLLPKGPFPGQPYFVTEVFNERLEGGRFLLTLKKRESLGRSWGSVNHEVLTFHVLEGAITVGEVNIEVVELVDKIQVGFVSVSTEQVVPSYVRHHLWNMPQEILRWVVNNHRLVSPTIEEVRPPIVSVETQWDVLD